ncbi:MAG TPA: ADOP family duplicated permease [Gemmatimonadaceae bacterium]|nr:ADOP family duplicated permease [Gemmatimonadaceae bacterium]
MTQGDPKWRRYLRFWRRDLAGDLDDELQFHFANRVSEFEASGMPRADAIAAARARFGDLESVRRDLAAIDTRIVRRVEMRQLFRDWTSDFRFAVRSFKRAPGFVFTALVTLVVGIAAVTTIFSFLDAVYFAPLPYKDANRIVALNEVRQGEPFSFSAVSADAVRLIQRSSRSFERVSSYRDAFGVASIGTEPRPVEILRTDTAFIPLFDLRPQVGRLLTPEEIDAGASAVMISDQLWRDAYGGDPSVVEQRLSIDGRSLAIVGVLPPGFRFPRQTDAITGMGRSLDTASSHERDYTVLAKLRPSVDRASARSEVREIGRRLRDVDATVFGHAQLDVQNEMLDRRARQALPMPGAFLGTGLLVLLIACANVANLFLARAAERRGEMAVRASLGAGRWRLVRQTLAETLLIGAIAAGLGTAASAALVRLGLHFIPTQGFPSWFHVSLDANVLLFVVAVTVLVTVTVGLTPALEGSRFDLARALKRGGDGGAAPSGIARASRRGLVVQLALAAALFVSAALIVRSYRRIVAVDLGYPADKIAVLTPLVDRVRYSDLNQLIEFAQRVAERTAAIPGVTAVALHGPFARLRSTTDSTLSRHSGASVPAVRRFDGRLIPDGDTVHALRSFDYQGVEVVSDAYFPMLNLRLRRGRSFGADDGPASTPVTVISARLALALWPTSNPLGHTIQVGATGDKLTIIGVVDDVRRMRGGSRGFTDAPLLTPYVSTRQGLTYTPELILTGRGDVAPLRSQAVSLVRSEDPNVILSTFSTLASLQGEALLVTRVFGGLIVALAAAALGLAIVGIYGVIAFGVEQRTREIGIRIAFGATSGDAVRMIMVDSVRFVAYGLIAGVVLAIALARVIRTMLFGVSSVDPLSYGAVCALFGAVAVLACYWPARRAARIDPLVALRTD